MGACGHFRTLKVKHRVTTPIEIENDNWQDCIFFDNKKDALLFANKMKDLILREYNRAKEQHWFDK